MKEGMLRQAEFGPSQVSVSLGVFEGKTFRKNSLLHLPASLCASVSLWFKIPLVCSGRVKGRRTIVLGAIGIGVKAMENRHYFDN
jgi:hypothetical protein